MRGKGEGDQGAGEQGQQEAQGSGFRLHGVSGFCQGSGHRLHGTSGFMGTTHVHQRPDLVCPEEEGPEVDLAPKHLLHLCGPQVLSAGPAASGRREERRKTGSKEWVSGVRRREGGVIRGGPGCVGEEGGRERGEDMEGRRKGQGKVGQDTSHPLTTHTKHTTHVHKHTPSIHEQQRHSRGKLDLDLCFVQLLPHRGPGRQRRPHGLRRDL
jgi:hypothetical protein